MVKFDQKKSFFHYETICLCSCCLIYHAKKVFINNIDKIDLISKVELKMSFSGIFAKINFRFKRRKSHKCLGTPIDFAIFLLLAPMAFFKKKFSHIRILLL